MEYLAWNKTYINLKCLLIQHPITFVLMYDTTYSMANKNRQILYLAWKNKSIDWVSQILVEIRL